MKNVRNPYVKAPVLIFGESNSEDHPHNDQVTQKEYTANEDGSFTVPDKTAADLVARGDWTIVEA